ncbi:MAG: hypothetical protein KAS64_06305 [Spirochaetes bacterium]|nr:hypothetical protein [Spirochaetota bacterium]
MKYLAIVVLVVCLIINFFIIKDYSVFADQKQKPIIYSNKTNIKTSILNVDSSNKINNYTLKKSEDDYLFSIAKNKNNDVSDRSYFTDKNNQRVRNTKFIKNSSRLTPPSFYRAIYLNNYTARVTRILKKYVKTAKKYGVNAFVMDVQDAVYFRTYMITKKNVRICVTNGIYPIARIVVFPYGLKKYPVAKSYINRILRIAKRAADMGFSEIQFDYIRFEDSGRLRWVSRKKRYALVEGILRRAKRMLQKYGVRISADVFGRVVLNRHDMIGQRLEGLDSVVDFICPMVYPSHFTWSKYMMSKPYYTVYKSSVSAKKRLKKAKLVMYIQGFWLKVRYSGLSLPMYIAHQIKACEDAKVKGYIIWNAAQRYSNTYKGMSLYYNAKKKGQQLPGFKKRLTSEKKKSSIRKTI